MAGEDFPMKRLFVTFVAVAAVLASPAAHSDLQETRATLRNHVLRLVNRDRARYRLPPVALDVQASTVADGYARAQIRNGTTGHFTTDGLPPYARYSLAGGNDGISENAAAWSASYSFSERALVEMAGRSQDAMMAEMAPNDGHKRTILDPHATHVGIGLAWERGEFRLVQHFVRRYIDWTRPLPRTAVSGKPATMSGTLRGVTIEGITVHHEPLPRELTPHAASAISTYALPGNRRQYTPRPARGTGALAAAMRSDFSVRDDGTFSFTVPFAEGPGLYTVVVWVRRDGHAAAFPASNVSVKVDGGLQSARRAGSMDARPH